MLASILFEGAYLLSGTEPETRSLCWTGPFHRSSDIVSITGCELLAGVSTGAVSLRCVAGVCERLGLPASTAYKDNVRRNPTPKHTGKQQNEAEPTVITFFVWGFSDTAEVSVEVWPALRASLLSGQPCLVLEPGYFLCPP